MVECGSGCGRGVLHPSVERGTRQSRRSFSISAAANRLCEHSENKRAHSRGLRVQHFHCWHVARARETQLARKLQKQLHKPLSP